jgi:hypothetical protein
LVAGERLQVTWTVNSARGAESAGTGGRPWSWVAKQAGNEEATCEQRAPWSPDLPGTRLQGGARGRLRAGLAQGQRREVLGAGVPGTQRSGDARHDDQDEDHGHQRKAAGSLAKGAHGVLSTDRVQARAAVVIALGHRQLDRQAPR